MNDAAAEPGPQSTATAAERILSLPLAMFLLVVAGIGVFAARRHLTAPTVPEAVRSLADGDLDGAERARALAALVRRGAASPLVGEQWAGLLAAVALGDRAAYEAALDRLGRVGPAALPAAAEQEQLHLGDPMLGNLGRAMWAEAVGKRDTALRRWRQVAAQCRLAPCPLAAELAASAVDRLR